MKKLLYGLISLVLISTAFAQTQNSGQITLSSASCPNSGATTFSSNGKNVVLQVPGSAGGIGVSITGTWSGTVNFYVTAGNGDQWVAPNDAYNVASGATGATTTTANGVFRMSAAGVQAVCVLASSLASGTVGVAIQTTAGSASTKAGSAAIASLTGATKYYNLFGTSTGVSTAPTTMVTNADSGGDICTREWDVAPLQNGGNNYQIVDARGETINGSASVFGTCALNPIGVNVAFASLFPTANSNGNGDHYLQPPGTIQTSIPWNLGDNQITDEGVNSGTSTGSGGTLGAPSILQATSSITSNQGTGETYNNGLYAVGLVAGTVRNGIGPYRSKLIGRNFDCFGQSIFGLTWYSGQEGTKGNNLSVNDCLIAAIRWGYSNSIGDGSDLHDFTASHSSVNQANKRGVNSCISNATPMGATGGLSWAVDTTGHVVFTYTNTPDVPPLPGYFVVFSGLATGGSHGTNICPSTGVCVYTIAAVSTGAGNNNGNWDDERWCPTGLSDSPSGCNNSANQFSSAKQFGISIPTPVGADTSSATQGTATLFTTQVQMNGFLGRETSDATLDALNCVNASYADLLVSGAQGSGIISNIHNEGDGTASPTTFGVLIGADAKTSGWTLRNIQASTAIGTGVYISDEWGAPTNINLDQMCGLIAGKTLINDIHNGVTLNRNSSICVNYLIDGSGNYPVTNANSTDLASAGQAIDTYNGVFAGYNSGLKFSLNAATGAETLTGQLATSAASTASTPAIDTTGTLEQGGTGTTNTPHVYEDFATGSEPTTWANGANTGTAFGVNGPASFAGNFLDFHVAGAASVFSVGSAGTLTVSSNKLATNSNGLISRYGNVATAGIGVPATLAVTSQKAETGSADASLLTLTPAASASTYRACVTISVSSATSGVISWTLSWTDSNGNAQANIAMPLFQFGTAAPNTTFTTSAAGNYSGCSTIDINNAAAAITAKWVGGGTSAAKVSATLERMQ